MQDGQPPPTDERGQMVVIPIAELIGELNEFLNDESNFRETDPEMFEEYWGVSTRG